jgi:hypothetical protein
MALSSMVSWRFGTLKKEMMKRNRKNVSAKIIQFSQGTL